ncbi:MAG: ATP-binding cassette domain-containing protein [Chitinophagaceae bacterium]|nr:ATP-binding cassette domain-containing protein [Chitinophagaceae bacterium]
MISINNLSYYIGSRIIYDEASLFIKPKDKIGLIGLNGTGKSTLLKMICEEITPDAGEINKSKECTIGFLNQDLLSFQSNESILDVVMKAFSLAQSIHIEIEKTIAQMEKNYTEELGEKLAKLQEKFEALDGYTIQSKAEEILQGIGFSNADLHRPLKEFSGGWRMRVILGKLLLEKPSILMLDEPTNHLDMPSIQWVENYLKSYDGAVIVVSHDRQFLNNTANCIVEVSGGKLNFYPGNYEFYLQEKSIRNEIQKNAYENQQAKIRQTERFIERFRAKATKARQVQSRVKLLEKMEVVNEVIDETAKVNFRFKFSKPSGKHVIHLENIQKKYETLPIIKDSNATIERGDKIALIGANGKGKSTLLRIIANIEPFEGSRREGHNVNYSMYAQHQLEALTLENDLLQELKSMGKDKTENELRSILGCFLFSDQDVFKKIKILSGGEKSRVALAKTLVSESNFLLLDEPTNHLDIQSVNILIQALQQYEGTFILVSHDRYFVSQVANKIWWLENQEIKTYPGKYEEYEWWKNKRSAEEIKDNTKQIPTSQNTSAKKQDTKPSSPIEKNNTHESKKMRKQLEEVETNINSIEQEIKILEQELLNTELYSNPQKLENINSSYILKKQTLNELQKKWESIVLQIEALEK